MLNTLSITASFVLLFRCCPFRLLKNPMQPYRFSVQVPDWTGPDRMEKLLYIIFNILYLKKKKNQKHTLSLVVLLYMKDLGLVMLRQPFPLWLSPHLIT